MEHTECAAWVSPELPEQLSSFVVAVLPAEGEQEPSAVAVLVDSA